MRILLIDDEKVGLRVRQLLLESQDHTVLTAETAGKGIDVFLYEEIDLVVLDYQLPDMTGEQLVRSLRQLKPDVPLILLSGQFTVSDEVLSAVSAFIIKGSGARELFRAIDRLA